MARPNDAVTLTAWDDTSALYAFHRDPRRFDRTLAAWRGRRQAPQDARIVMVADEDFLAWQRNGWPRTVAVTQKRWAPPRLLIEFTIRTRQYGTVSCCTNRGRRDGARNYSYVSLTPPAGRAGSRTRRAAVPYLAATVASIPPKFNFRRCQ
jgi:hypothetical protein